MNGFLQLSREKTAPFEERCVRSVRDAWWMEVDGEKRGRNTREYCTAMTMVMQNVRVTTTAPPDHQGGVIHEE